MFMTNQKVIRRAIRYTGLVLLVTQALVLVVACDERTSNAARERTPVAETSSALAPTSRVEATSRAPLVSAVDSGVGSVATSHTTPQVSPTPSSAPPARTPTSSPRPAKTPEAITTPGGAIDEDIEDSPCRPWAIHLDAFWFWENAVHWHPTGSVVYFSQGPLVYAAAMDGSRVKVVADASAIERDHDFPGRRVFRRYGPMTSFDVSPRGELVYSTCAYEHDMGRALGRERGYELATASVGGSEVQRLTRNARFDNYPSWSPDGRRIALVVGRSTTYDVFRSAGVGVVAADGSHRRDFGIDKHAVGFHPPQWSPDGTRLAVIGRGNDLRGDYTIFIVEPEGWEQRRLGRTISAPSWSPDGQRLAFVGAADDDDGTWGLLTMAANGTDVRQIPLPPDWEPHYVGGHGILTEMAEFGDGWIPTLAWSPAGDQLLYTCGRRICVVALDGTPVGRSPIDWWSGSVAAWSPDGARIAVAAGAVWQTRGLEQSGGPALYTMAPDGSDVRELAAYDATGEVRPLGPRPANVHVDVTGCAAGLAVAEPAATPGLVRDCAALLRVQAAWQHEFNWSPDVPIGEWEGVTLGGSPPRVRELRVWHQVLGPIPPALSALDQLQVLDLGGSVLGGTIPGEMGQLTELVRLDLAGTLLSGPIPPVLGELAALRTLDLSNNDLSGEIPRELGQLANLNDVRLGGNQLTGCVPAGLRPTENVSRWDQGLPRCEAGA